MTEEATETNENNQATDSLITEQPSALNFAEGKPDGFPDDFWDAEKKAPAVDKLFNSYTQEKKRAEGLRVKLSKGEYEGKAPENVAEYTLSLSDELRPLVPNDDPLLQVAREAAKAKGMPKEMFDSTFTPIIAKLAELKSAAEKPPSPEEIEAERLAKIEKLGPGGDKVVSALGAFIDQLHKGGTFSQAEAIAAKNMVFDADSARVMNKLRMMAGGRDQVPVEMTVETNSASRSDVETKMAKAMLAGNEAEYTKYSGMLARMQ